LRRKHEIYAPASEVVTDSSRSKLEEQVGKFTAGDNDASQAHAVDIDGGRGEGFAGAPPSSCESRADHRNATARTPLKNLEYAGAECSARLGTNLRKNETVSLGLPAVGTKDAHWRWSVHDEPRQDATVRGIARTAKTMGTVRRPDKKTVDNVIDRARTHRDIGRLAYTDAVEFDQEVQKLLRETSPAAARAEDIHVLEMALQPNLTQSMRKLENEAIVIYDDAATAQPRMPRRRERRTRACGRARKEDSTPQTRSTRTTDATDERCRTWHM
jgi:rRNA maturation endonuclease Nob1